MIKITNASELAQDLLYLVCGIISCITVAIKIIIPTYYHTQCMIHNFSFTLEGTSGQALTAQGPFMLRWINNSPSVNGNTVRVDLAIGPSYKSVMCRLNPRPAQNCKVTSNAIVGKPCIWDTSWMEQLVIVNCIILTGSSGSVTFTGLPSGRRRMYNFTVEGTTPAGEKVIMYRTFRTGTCT